MSTGLQIYTFGRLTVERGGHVLESFISAKATLLLVYLAMHPWEHNRKKLASLFWSETSDEQALKNLRTVLSSVRQQTGNAIIATHDSLSINPDESVIVDASTFESGCNRIFSAGGKSNLKSLQDLAQLYQGEFLGGVVIRDAEEFDAWVSEKQRQFHHLYTRLLLEVVETAAQEADYNVGLEYAWKLVSTDSLWDVAQRKLMLMLAYTNRTNEALQQYERFMRLLDEEVGATPEAETTALYERIRNRDLSAPAAPTRSGIVLPDMPFVDPVEDIEIAQRMLSTPQCKLLTVFGISGIGKTALITQIAYHRQHHYRDGTALVSLKRGQSAHDLPYMVASALKIDYPSQADHSAIEEIVLDHLRSSQMLLVFDNYEFILPDTQFLENVLEFAPQVQLMVGSQSPLNIFREWLLPLRGLNVPDETDEKPEHSESVRLFELTARRINPRFNLTDHKAEVARICQLVDGLPLAIIIAASWTQIVPMRKIIEHLIEGQEYNLPLQQSLPEHHQSLDLMLEYTWNTLSQNEQSALTALSIFNINFDLEEVEGICEIDMSTLASLIQKSLIQRFEDKYRMHQLVWRYARKKLLVNDEQKLALAKRYRKFFAHTLQTLQRQQMVTHDYLLSIDTRYANIWNFDWMPKSYQPLYTLSLSRYLILFWAISRVDALPEITNYFKSLPEQELPPEMRRLLHVQIARISFTQEKYVQAFQAMLKALRTVVDVYVWFDHAIMYLLYAPLFSLKDSGEEDITVLIDEETIFRTTSLRLSMLYLNMADLESAHAFLNELEADASDLERAMVSAVRGSIAAYEGDFAESGRLFKRALSSINAEQHPELSTSLQAALQETERQQQ